MTSPQEMFVLQLARVSRRAKRVVKHLQRADRDDIIAAAIAWCWEHRASYSLVTSLDTWFVGAVRDAYKSWLRGEAREAAEVIEDIGGPDDTSARAQVMQAIDKIQARVAAMPEIEQKIAAMLVRQWTQDEITAELKVSEHRVVDVRRKLLPLQRHVPDTIDYRILVRRTVQLDSDGANYDPAAIDHEIAKLEFPPPHGKDCPPCWRCKWFEGYLPDGKRSVGLEVVEKDVREAIANTEAEKIRIANEVRSGNI